MSQLLALMKSVSGFFLCGCLVLTGPLLAWRQAPPQEKSGQESQPFSELLLAQKSLDEAQALIEKHPDRITADGQKALRARCSESLKKSEFKAALHGCALALRVGEKLNLPPQELVVMLHNLGDAQRSLSSFSESLKSYRQSLALAEQVSDKALIARSLDSIGAIHRQQGDFARAIESYEKSLALREALGERAAMAPTLVNLGMAQVLRGFYDPAHENLQKALAIYQEAGNRQGIVTALSNLGLWNYHRGNNAVALDYYQRSLSISEALGRKDYVANMLNNVGMAHYADGNYQKALEYYQRSLHLNRELGARVQVANTLNSIGVIHRLRGNNELALENYQESLKIKEAIGDRPGIALTLMNIGNLHSLQKDHATAQSCYERSLALAEQMGEGPRIAQVLNNIGRVARLQGDYVKASECYSRSLKIREEMGEKPGIASTLLGLASLFRDQRDYVQALEKAEAAAALSKQIGRRETFWHARDFAGRLHLANGNRDEARRAFQEAIETIEMIRAQAGGGEQEQQQFFEDKVTPYHSMVALLVRENKAGEALAYAERAKGRVLLDVLRSGKINIAKSLTAQEEAEERRLRKELVAAGTGLSQESVKPRPEPARVAELNAKVRQLRLDYDRFRNAIYAAHPQLKTQRGESPPIAADQLRDLFADDDTAILEYVVTEETTYVVVVTRAPPGVSPGNDAKHSVSVGAYAIAIQQKDLAQRVAGFRALLADRDLSFRTPAAELYRLLIDPAAESLKGKKRLIVVPDDVLWELPFQALQSANSRYLLEDFALSYVPSLSVLREMKPRSAGLPPTLLAVGNPAGAVGATEKPVGTRQSRLENLPEAEKEAKTLGRIYGPDRSRVLLGADASEERFKKEAGQYRLVHLATHGVLNNSSPMYSHLVLSRGETQAEEDGLLEAWEILKMDLSADLVVLSACESARGRVGSGEGLIGLSWALFVAGSPCTIVSQWKVDSASTTELMSAFHRTLASGSRARSGAIVPAEALRTAALQLLKKPEYRHPFYWAGFVTVGRGF